MTPGRRSAPLFAVALSAIVAGCGSAHRPPVRPHAATERPGAVQVPQTIPAPAPTRIPAPAAAVAVIKAWSNALRRGDIAGAARYFALPSVMINGPDANGNGVLIRIDSRASARAANVTLPCGARFISADQRGRYVNALFRLTNRPGPGGGCGTGAGQTARTNFVISAGRIVEWIRAPDDPGDNPGTTPAPLPGGQGSGPAV
ncbi:MAG TPA: hypothetical protein VMD09_05620 [Solirubrobacteraceae bacterium]|nr:hypothetical protein [Solirubrobacteraceae bacterium]